MDSVRVDFQLDQKISKRRFFQDIKNSFQWVIGNGLKPTQFFSFQNISTNTVARDVQSFGRNGSWLAGWLSSDQNFCANLAQTCDEHMLKISKWYLDSYSWVPNKRVYMLKFSSNFSSIHFLIRYYMTNRFSPISKEHKQNNSLWCIFVFLAKIVPIL